MKTGPDYGNCQFLPVVYSDERGQKSGKEGGVFSICGDGMT
jgi:hypothetical protein